MLLREKMENIRRLHPHVSPHGQLHTTVKETSTRYKRVTLWVLFVSNENTHLLRNHVFQKEASMSPSEWAAWFEANLKLIHANAVLPGLAVRTNKQWAVQRILGWVGDAEHKTKNSAAHRARNKAKVERRKNG